jgi:hypothetical protein
MNADRQSKPKITPMSHIAVIADIARDRKGNTLRRRLTLMNADGDRKGKSKSKSI